MLIHTVLRSASPEENANAEAISGGFAQQPGATLTTMPQTTSDDIDMFATPGGSLHSTSSAPARPPTLSRQSSVGAISTTEVPSEALRLLIPAVVAAAVKSGTITKPRLLATAEAELPPGSCPSKKATKEEVAEALFVHMGLRLLLEWATLDEELDDEVDVEEMREWLEETKGKALLDLTIEEEVRDALRGQNNE